MLKAANVSLAGRVGIGGSYVTTIVKGDVGSVRADRVETCPIAGTIRRGTDPLEYAENIRSLLNSFKEESELTMCTDVDRNYKSRICVPGSVTVIGRRQIEMYSRLIHTVDHIEGRLRPGLDALDAFLSHMWAVTVTGAPKTWAMQFIEDHEGGPRRWYGGAVGMIGFDGAMNTGLTLRTAHIRDGVAAVRAGATLLFDSDPLAEERETELKARALLETLAEAGTPAPEPHSAQRNAALRPPGTGPGELPATACGCSWWIIRIRSCTRWRAISVSRGRTWRRCAPAFRRPPWTSSHRTSSCCRPGLGGHPISRAPACWRSLTRGAWRHLAFAWGCRRWWSTPGESSICSRNRCTASRDWCCAARRAPGASRREAR